MGAQLKQGRGGGRTQDLGGKGGHQGKTDRLEGVGRGPGQVVQRVNETLRGMSDVK